MSEKAKKAAAPEITSVVAEKILAELDRVHMRVPKF